MNTDEKSLLLAEHLEGFRKWSYESLAAEIDRTASQHDCLKCCDGTFDDGTEYYMEFNVFWDDRKGGNVRVCGDISTPPLPLIQRILSFQTPDATDSFIKAPDGSFVGE